MIKRVGGNSFSALPSNRCFADNRAGNGRTGMHVLFSCRRNDRTDNRRACYQPPRPSAARLPIYGDAG